MPALRDSGLGPEAEHPEYAGQYRLEARLGSGGMGVVHLARSSSGLTLAVKVVHAEFAQDPEFRGRFRQEVAAARRVSGAFTASVVDADPDAERPWMATLHIPGPSLSDHVKRNGPMVPAEVRQLAAGLAEALRDIHRAGVVHRDLKPGNVLLAADGPKVIDFGISRPSDSEMRTETGKLIGTPPFMAPEQFQRPREVGPAADVFALGSVLVHAATGRGPFDSDSPYLVAYQVVHDEADLAGVPEELAPLIESCLAKDPADRPTPDALMELLRTAAAEDGARPAAVPVGAPLPGEASGSAPPDAPIPGQPQPVRSRATPPRAETTHVRAPVPPAPAARRPARTALLRARRWPLWAALALVVTGAGTFAGIRALAPAGDGQDPALQVHPSQADQARFRPWHTTLTKRPQGYAAELPFCTTGSGAVFCGRAGTLAARLDPGTGQVAWRRKDDATTGKNSLKTTASPTPPALSGGLLYVFSADAKRLMALDPSADGKGATRWSKDVSGYEGGARIVGDQVLLTAADGTVTALDSATHRQLWHKRFPGHALPAFTAFGDPHTAYAAENTPDGTGTQVTAIDPAHGSVRWSHRLPGLLTVAGPGTSGALYLTVTDRTFTYRATAVLRYDPATGHTRRLKLTAPLDGASAVVHGESVYLLAEGGTLQAVGERTWDTETSVSRGSAPVVSGGRLYFTAADGRLLAINTRSGELLGQTPPRMNGRHNGFVEMLPAPLVDGRRGRIYAAAPDGSVFSAAAGDPAGW
ncbi:serine/threonine protein kinase [Streptomyces sp. TM32]|uniref:protein kinase domain-containing protein n=1 Tax=Streptomyces sp. TM32 TaxID=1652669 RepID=UPI0010112349|nr:PQQ-binding-like beta-propeller repeat protein [Streptomyces sp. TM32]RXS83876.1 serine/threonine protein kinase [Streptomyces sp. TM32]